MDNRVRLNEICIIGQPKCGYAFSSSRSCFIGYGFKTSPLEVDILTGILEERGIEAVQAGDRLAAGQNAFCTKICSKIITSQFCIVIANNDDSLTGEIPNANVYLEYGLMLAFNKHVVPFQLESQALAFNVAGLDTVKYTPSNFKEKASIAIDEAIKVTTPDAGPPPFSQVLDTFFLANNVLLCRIDNEGEQVILSRGSGLGYSLLCDFTGWNYMYFGIFTQITPAEIRWRLQRTQNILDGILTSVDFRVKAGYATNDQQKIALEAMSRFAIWLVVSDTSVKEELLAWSDSTKFPYHLRVFLDKDVRDQFDRIATGEEFSS